jgi:hypothetical protein
MMSELSGGTAHPAAGAKSNRMIKDKIVFMRNSGFFQKGYISVTHEMRKGLRNIDIGH